MGTPRIDTTELQARIDALDEAELRARRTMKWTRYPPDVLPAWVAEMDYPLAPAVRAAMLDVLDRGDLGYPVAHGFAEAFAGWAERELGWSPDPALGVPVADVMAGIEAALRELTEPGDGVVALTPAYPPFFGQLTDTGRRIVPCPLLDGPQRWELDLQRLDDALAESRALLLCHPHNPTGRVWTPAELRAIAELVDAHGAHVISDEVHAPMRAASFTPYAASCDAAAAHTVTVTSVSKGWNVPGIKGALLQAQPATAHVTAAVPERELIRISVPGLAGSIAAWTDDGGWLDVVRAYLERTRAAVADWVARTPGVRAHPPDAGYLAWLDLRGTGLGRSDQGHDPATVLLERGRVAVNPGHTFAVPPAAGHGFVRLNHATSLPLLDQVLARIDRGLDRGLDRALDRELGGGPGG